MVSIFTKTQRIAQVVTGCMLVIAVPALQAKPLAMLQTIAAEGDGLVPFAQALASQQQQNAATTAANPATEKRRASATLPPSKQDNGEWVNLAKQADDNVNIFEIAKELEHAVKEHAHDKPVNPGNMQHFSQGNGHQPTLSDAPALQLAEATSGQVPTGLNMPSTAPTKTTTPKPNTHSNAYQASRPDTVSPQTAPSPLITPGSTTSQMAAPLPAPTLLPPAPIPNKPRPQLPPALQVQQQPQAAVPVVPSWQPPSAFQQQQQDSDSAESQAEAIARIKAENEKAQREYADNVRENAYRQMELEAFPMSPNHIIKLRKKLDETQRAQEVFPGTPPEPVSTSMIVNLSPGTTPPVVRLGLGFVSSLVFVDATGAPWQILSYDVGAPDIFNIQWDKDSNMLLIQPHRPYTYGNIAVNLKGLNTPVMLTLVPGQRVIDYRVDLRVQALGPHPNEDLLGDGLPANANALLLNFLNGAAPDSAKPLIVHGGHTQAWVFRNKLYVRSHYKVISPSWLASMTSADGTHVYELPKAPVLLLSRHGKIVSMQLEGF